MNTAKKLHKQNGLSMPELTIVVAIIAILAATLWPKITRILSGIRADKVTNCRIPDDCIDKNRYPLFLARAVLRELVQSLQTTGSL